MTFLEMPLTKSWKLDVDSPFMGDLRGDLDREDDEKDDKDLEDPDDERGDANDGRRLAFADMTKGEI